MHTYDHAITLACFGAAVDVLDKHPNTLLEDIGTYLVTDPALQPLRRLLRFGGGTFSRVPGFARGTARPRAARDAGGRSAGNHA
jgi:hypothetical protein